MPDVEFICLANSRKHSGRCVTGLRTDGGGWVRPVRDSSDGALFSLDYTLDDGKEAALLDVIRIALTRARPEPHQPENWLYHSSTWRLVRRISPTAAGPILLGDQRDRTPYTTFLAQPALASLALIEPHTIYWHITTSFRGNRQTQARFNHTGHFYNLSITDPRFEQRLSGLGPGYHPRTAAAIGTSDRVLFTISLGEPMHTTGDCFKLIAGVLVLPA